MKYILFLFCILFFHSFGFADQGLKPDSNVNLNLDGFKKTTFGNTNTTYSGNLPDYNVGSTTYGLKNTLTYGYGASSSTIRFGQPTCTIDTPQYCVLYSSCVAAGGYWNAIDSNCGRSECHFGTTPDASDPLKCKCNNDVYAFVQRGNFLQSCPSTCFSKPNQSYSFMKKACECNEGFTMATNGTCVANTPPPAPQNQDVNECLRELVDKAATCETSANEAVSKCEFEPEDESLKALHGLLLSGKGSAGENCDRAATASTSSYYKTEDNRKSCDDGINSCKSTCTDVKKYLNENKERLYNSCRERAMQAQVNSGPPLPADRFNPLWDQENRPTLDTQFQGLISRVDAGNATCTSGTAVQNREKLTASMNEMNSSAKQASTCSCQLNSGGSGCASTPGPADCSANPSAAGCAKVADNCFDKNNTSLKCICFRNPDSEACLGAKAKFNIKSAESDVSPFASAKTADTRAANNSSINGMASGQNSEGESTIGVNPGREKYGINVNDELGAPPAASGSTVSSEASKSTPSAGGSSSGGSLGGANSPNSKTAAQSAQSDSTLVRRIGGLFESAKSAVGGIFKKGGNDSSDGHYRDSAAGSNGQGFDPRKFRPRGTVVRGIASEEELAGKHEDIWKVMNKQYKIQDQKDNFIFDSGKN